MISRSSSKSNGLPTISSTASSSYIPMFSGEEMGRKDNDSSVIVAFSKFPY